MNSISRVPAQLARRLRPAVEATLTPKQLAKIFGDVEFKTLGPFAAPEPSIGAAVRLASGRVATLAYGKGSHLLRVDLPANDSVQAFLGEVTLPDKAITWRRRQRARPSAQAHARTAKKPAKKATAKAKPAAAKKAAAKKPAGKRLQRAR